MTKPDIWTVEFSHGVWGCWGFLKDCIYCGLLTAGVVLHLETKNHLDRGRIYVNGPLVS